MAQAFRSTRVIAPHGVIAGTVIEHKGRIARIAAWNDVPAGIPLHDYGDAPILPGLVDTHVHINEPGRTEWEGFWTATRAAASGGVTTLVDMPLNCIPETTTVAALEAKRAAAQGKAWVDWTAWGGVVKGNAHELKALARAGVPGFKCFMVESGVEGFQWVDESELRKALAELRGTGLPLLVHAEIPGPIEQAIAQIGPGANWRKYVFHLSSRPRNAETDAIAMLIWLADEFKTPIHIVHLSNALAATMLQRAREAGTPITVETCPHYLSFDSDEIPDGATEFKCAPPIRRADNRERLWKALEDGIIDMVASDHSPCPPEMKDREEGRFDKAWGGIASLGLALPVMWTGMCQRGIQLDRIAAWMAEKPAQLAGLRGRKGALVEGGDADLVVFNPDEEWTVTESDVHFRHKLSPYIGVRLRGRVKETWLRGERIFSNGTFSDEPHGRVE
ncbi:MAG: allantoinase AllB [Acidobacteriota bacterium]|nr:allantoinase AllB [Acidobacteriota bacterium]